MSAKELSQIQIMEKLKRGELTAPQVAEMIGLSTRQVHRRKAKYLKEGPKSLVHKGRGQHSNRKIDKKEEVRIVKILEAEYSDFKPTFAHEKLVEIHGVKISKETVRKIMIDNKIWIPKSRKKKARIHQMRKRRSCRGELVQTDASPHAWFEDRRDICDLVLFVDDATSDILWAEFAESETTKAYMEALWGYTLKEGKPLALYSDKHSIFRINTTRKHSVGIEDNNGLTQFGRAMKQLEIELICAETAQAKGRVERAFKTLQDRLVKEMRLRGISTIEEGNKFLRTFYIEEYNRKFGVTPESETNVHRLLMPEEKLEEILCIQKQRVISKNLEVQYENKIYQIQVESRYEYTLRKQRVMMKEKLDGEILIEYKGRNLDYKIHGERPGTRIVNSKEINTTVDEITKNRPKVYRFNILGRTFLLC